MPPIDFSALLNNIAQLFDMLFPAIAVIIGTTFGIVIIRMMTKALRESFDGTTTNWPPSIYKSVKAKRETLPLDEITEKPKRGLVTLGDDGELADIPGEASLEDYRIIR